MGISFGKGITGASSLAAGSSITGIESPATRVDSSAEAASDRKPAAVTDVFASLFGEADAIAASKSAETASPAAGNSVESLSSGSVSETANGRRCQIVFMDGSLFGRSNKLAVVCRRSRSSNSSPGTIKFLGTARAVGDRCGGGQLFIKRKSRRRESRDISPFPSTAQSPH